MIWEKSFGSFGLSLVGSFQVRFSSFLVSLVCFCVECSRLLEIVLVSFRLSMFLVCFRFVQLLWVVAGLQGRVRFKVFSCCCRLLYVVSVVLSFSSCNRSFGIF